MYPRGSVTGSQGEKDERGPTEEDFGEAMHLLFKTAFSFLGLLILIAGLLSTVVIIFYVQGRVSSLNTELELMKRRKEIQKKIPYKSATHEPNTAHEPIDYFDRLVSINLDNLADYYSLVKGQTNNSFLFSAAAGSIGLILIIIGLVVGYNGGTNNQIVSFISAGSGIITEFITGVFFYLYSRTVRQMKEYHDSLLAVQNILLSFKILKDIQDESEKTKMMGNMLSYLVNNKTTSNNAASK